MKELRHAHTTNTYLCSAHDHGRAGSSAPHALGSPLTTAAPPDAAPRQAGLLFVENVGQFDPRARFQVQGDGSVVHLAADALWFTLSAGGPASAPARRSPDLAPSAVLAASPSCGVAEASQGLGALGDRRRQHDTYSPDLAAGSLSARGVRLKLSFVGAGSQPRIEPFGRLATDVSYFLGDDPARWRAAVPVWSGVRYRDLYPGIDLEISGQDGRLTQRLVARPGADLNAVRLRVEGADDVAIAGDRLRLDTAAGTFALPLLEVVTSDGALIAPALAARKLHGNDIAALFLRSPALTSGSIAQGESDLLYSTFIGGGNGEEESHSIAVGANRATFIAGYSLATDFPTTPGAFDTSANGLSDGFIVKLNAAGTGPLLYGTFLGGGQDDSGKEIVVDGAGAAYVVGTTGSPAFPTTAEAYDTSYNGGDSDVFMVKLTIGGSPALSYATFLGCGAAEFGDGIEVDGGGHVYLAGFTYSSTFPTTPGAFDPSFNGGDRDAFIAKFGFGTPPRHFIAGQVRDGDGAPVAGVTITPDNGNPVTTGADGTYKIDQLEPGTYTLTPSRSGYTFNPPQRQVSVPPDAGGQNFTVTTPLYTISGQVTDSSNNPVAGITVSDGNGHTATTSSDGTYTLTNLQAGTYTITPAREGYRFEPASLAVAVPPDATGRNFIAEDLAPTFTIRGRVTSGGKPLAGITVADNQSHSTTTNADGTYTLSSLRAGTYTITASGGEYTFEPQSRTLSVPPNAEAQDFIDKTPLVRHTRLPLIMMLRQTGPQLCDPYEPNNYQLVDPWGPLESGRVYEAKICANDQEERFPDSKYEDNYYFEATTGEPIIVRLTIPPKLVNHFAIAVYEGGRLNHVEGCYIDQVRNVTYDLPCQIPKPGRYVVRLFSTENVVDNDNFYTFQVEFE